MDPSKRESTCSVLHEQGYVDDYGVQLKKKDGTPLDVSVSSSFCYDDHGNPIGIEGIIRDITERKRMEEELRCNEARYRLMADNIRDLIWTMDLKMNLTYVSPSMQTMYGYSPEEARGSRFEKLLTPDSARKVLELYKIIRDLMKQKTLSGRGFSETLVLEHVRKDGSTFWGETRVSITVDGDGLIVGMQAVTRDITERKRAEALIKDKEAAEIASRAKSEFLARMSHEIRTPLNGIIGMTELCLGQNPDENLKGLLETIYGEARNLSGLISDILDLAKIEAGKMVLEEAPFDLAELLRTVTDGFAPRAKEQGLDFAAFLAPEIPTGLCGDAVRLRQVLVNLIGNALKFTPKGKVSVTGELVRDMGDGVVIQFSVSDTGIGIPLDRQQRIFEPFEQADGSTTRQYGGTGLGVAIAREIVKMMGGRIGVVSEPGEGSTFWFTAEMKKEPGAGPSERKRKHRRSSRCRGARAKIPARPPDPSGRRLCHQPGSRPEASRGGRPLRLAGVQRAGGDRSLRKRELRSHFHGHPDAGHGRHRGHEAHPRPREGQRERRPHSHPCLDGARRQRVYRCMPPGRDG